MIRNTSKAEPLEQLVVAMMGERGILEQERNGQIELLNSDALPAQCSGPSLTSTVNRKVLEEAGVVFGEPLANDPLFIAALLPDGWRKEATQHSMWTELKDETGKVRADIFYKAAFYDRRAYMRLRVDNDAQEKSNESE